MYVHCLTFFVIAENVITLRSCYNCFMEIEIISIGNSNGIILPKKLMDRFGLNRHDVLMIPDTSLDLCFTKRGDDVGGSDFFASLPACMGAYGGDTEQYLENIEEPANEE